MPRGAREWITVLWPAFVAACLLEIVVFAAFDPHHVQAFGTSIEADPDAVLSIAFFAFWAISAAAGLVTWTLSRGADRTDRPAPRAGDAPADRRRSAPHGPARGPEA
ncbi:MAG TPA: hypothetical protein VEA81_05060 [Burkholderiaceae bacterium]|nr:hypothetical protein [Burkholderiaceae bacterium]